MICALLRIFYNAITKLFLFVCLFSKARNPLLQRKGRRYRRTAGTTAITEKAIFEQKSNRILYGSKQMLQYGFSFLISEG